MEPRRTERAAAPSADVDARTSLALWLRQGRAVRKLSIDDVSRVTKIQTRILERIESGRFDGLPAPVFVRGFVRSFARCVGLDEAEAIERFGACAAGEAPPVANAKAKAFAETMAMQRPEGEASGMIARRSRIDVLDAIPPVAVATEITMPVEISAPTEISPIAGESAPCMAAPSVSETGAIAATDPTKKKRAARKKTSTVDPIDPASPKPRARKRKPTVSVATSTTDTSGGTASSVETTTVKPTASAAGPVDTNPQDPTAVAELSAVEAIAAQLRIEAAAVDAMNAAPEPIDATVSEALASSTASSIASAITSSSSTSAEISSSTSRTTTSSIEPSADPATEPSTDSSIDGSTLEAAQQQSSGDSTATNAAEHKAQEATGTWQPTMPAMQTSPTPPSVPWRRVRAAPSTAPIIPTLIIDDADPDQAERLQELRMAEKDQRVSFLPAILLDREDRSRQGGLTLAVIILLIAATLTLSYLMRRPSASGDGVTLADSPPSLILG